MVTIFGRTFEHLIITSTIGNPIYIYRVRTEDGYYIHTAELGANIYKTATAIYDGDDLDAIVIVHESELPTDAVIMGGGTTKPKTEIASEDDNTDTVTE